jgi:Domain of unknown function (DUF5655)
MADSLRPLWICPNCGNAFVNPNSWHSCGRWPLESHFVDRPVARELFDLLRAALEEHGPLTTVSSKTRIAFMTRVRFASVTVRKDYLRLALWLTRPLASPRVVKLEDFGPETFVVTIELRKPDDVDAELRELLVEARVVGDQEHARQRRRYVQ